jgi:hypothetical protein
MRGDEELPTDEYEQFLRGAEEPISLDAFRAAIEETISQTPQYKTTIDAIAAPRVHETLDISRRQAADRGIWRYLAVIEVPEFVRHRWKFNERNEMRARFMGSRRWDGNALSRLWWAAELTHDPEAGYEYTEQVFSTQHLARAIFDRRFSHYPRATKAFIDVFGDDNQETVEAAVKEFNSWLTTIRIEVLPQTHLKRELESIRSGVMERTE